jgi:cephalosporin hydroxylase
LVDNTRTDKGTVHSYLGLYSEILAPKQHTAMNVLEVGICFGGSIKLWHDYFPNATIHAIDIMLYESVWDELKNKERIQLHTSSAVNATRVDAYDAEWVTKTFGGMEFDFMLDDGPHTLESMIAFIKLYLPLLAKGGVLIIEDVQDYSWFAKLTDAVGDNPEFSIKQYDLRKVKSRYDDLVFCVTRQSM